MSEIKSSKTSKGLGRGLGKKGLGKGIGALIPEDDDVKVKEVIKEVIVKEPADTKIRISLIEPNKEQPRKAFDEDALIG